MRAPSKSRADEVVREIIDATRDQPLGEWDIGPELDVRTTIRYLCELDREVSYRGTKSRTPIRGKRQENAEDFAALLKQLKALQKTLSKVSGPALFLLFSGEDEDDVGSDKIPPEEVQQRMLRRLRNVTATLAYMRARCNFLLEKRPGEHGGADYRQRRVAYEAWHLLRRSGKSPAGGTMDSLYGKVASLLFEAVTGEANKDLQWVCKAALRLADEGGGQIELS